MISLSEFLEDCFAIFPFVEFNNDIKDMINKEIQHLPKKLKDMAMNDIKMPKEPFWKTKRRIFYLNVLFLTY